MRLLMSEVLPKEEGTGGRESLSIFIYEVPETFKTSPDHSVKFKGH